MSARSIGQYRGPHRDMVERLAFLATVLLAGATIWLTPLPPMTDLPQHAGQVALWRDLLLGTSKWQGLVYINTFTPYLLGYGFALLLSFVMPVVAALKLTLALAYYGFVAACVLLRRRLGSDRRLDWLFIPGFFGFAYVMGFYSFLIAAPIGLLFVLLAHRYADRPAPAGGGLLILGGMALFFSHGLVFLFAAGIGGAVLLTRSRSAKRFLIATAPYAVLGLLCALYALVRVRYETGTPPELLATSWGWDLSRLKFLLYPIGRFSADRIFVPVVVLMLAAPLVLGARFNRRDFTAFVPILCLFLVWALSPSYVPLLDAYDLYQRFAIFLLPFYALVFCAPDPEAGAGRRLSTGRALLAGLWLPLLCWFFLGIRAERLVAFARESTAFEEVLAATPPGQRALGLVLEPVSAATGNLGAYVNFPLWYQSEKGGLVDFNFARLLPQVVRYRKEWTPVDVRAGGSALKAFDWTLFHAEIYRYFFVRHAGPLPSSYFPDGPCAPVLRASAGDWSVFENLRCYRESTPGG